MYKLVKRVEDGYSAFNNNTYRTLEVAAYALFVARTTSALFPKECDLEIADITREGNQIVPYEDYKDLRIRVGDGKVL